MALNKFIFSLLTSSLAAKHFLVQTRGNLKSYFCNSIRLIIGLGGHADTSGGDYSEGMMNNSI